MIYFIQDRRTNAIKIGYTGGDPRERMSALQTGNPTELVLLAQMEGDMSREAELHKQFATARMVGEWFNPVPELLEFMLLNASRTAWHQGRDSVPSNVFGWLSPDEYWGEGLCAEQFGSAAHIECPKCGCENCHVLGARNLRGYETDRAPDDLPCTGDVGWAGRGDGVVVEMCCESGCAWQLCIGFHKGDAFMFTRSGAAEQAAEDARWAEIREQFAQPA